MYLTDNAVELILVGKALTDHSIVQAGVKKHSVCIVRETEEIEEKGVLICRLCDGYSKLIAGDFQDVDVFKVLVREERRLARFRLARTVGGGCCFWGCIVSFV